MKLKIRNGTKSEELALLHKHLGEAMKCIEAAAEVRNQNSRPALLLESIDDLTGLHTKLCSMIYHLEGEFVLNEGSNSPFANRDNPDYWIQWLSQKTVDGARK